ncbi:unnamed protein product [Diatraea saccharalis]|uniref:Uncharacterized protein n=1 Tax=Diatraea saccharalis TaxID=40085 RepID=A0A9N9RF93_9NEOP|nr:unnamed protein product [Diatraea saccharalis]
MRILSDVRISLQKRQPLNLELKSRTTVAESQGNATIYAWSSWGSWSTCSRSCGGGVAVQERQCLPRDPASYSIDNRIDKSISTTSNVLSLGRGPRYKSSLSCQEFPVPLNRFNAYLQRQIAV